MQYSVTKYIVLFLLSMLCFAENISGQDYDCNERLKLADNLFIAGNIDSVTVLLEPCINKFDRTHKVDAYKLLILSYIYLNRYSLAEMVMEQLLRLEPEVGTENINSYEFMRIYNSYRTKPVFGIGGSLALNVTIPIFIHASQNTLLNTNSKTASTGGIGFSVGPSFQFYPFKKSYIEFQTVFKQQSFSFQNIVLNFAEVSFAETQRVISFPVAYIQEFTNIKIKPYIKAGVGVSILLNSTATVERRYIDASEFSQRSIPIATIPIADQRKYIQFNVLAGFGAVYKIRRGKIYVEIEFENMINNVVQTNKRFSNSNLIYNYYYTDRDFLESYFSIKFKYIRSFYKPIKKIISVNNLNN